MLEYLIVASKHPNARVRESVLLCFMTAIKSLVGSSVIVPLGDLLPVVLALLNDRGSEVREAAVATLESMYQHVGPPLVDELQAKLLRPAQLKPVLERLALVPLVPEELRVPLLYVPRPTPWHLHLIGCLLHSLYFLLFCLSFFLSLPAFLHCHFLGVCVLLLLLLLASPVVRKGTKPRSSMAPARPATAHSRMSMSSSQGHGLDSQGNSGRPAPPASVSVSEADTIFPGPLSPLRVEHIRRGSFTPDLRASQVWANVLSIIHHS